MKVEISKVSANDGEVQARVRVEVCCNGALTRDELFTVSRQLTDKVADALRNIRFTDFGPSNTVVRL